jgi:hypothetical protein
MPNYFPDLAQEPEEPGGTITTDGGPTTIYVNPGDSERHADASNERSPATSTEA